MKSTANEAWKGIVMNNSKRDSSYNSLSLSAWPIQKPNLLPRARCFPVGGETAYPHSRNASFNLWEERMKLRRMSITSWFVVRSSDSN